MVCIPLTARHCASQRKRAAEHADWMQSGGLYGHKPMVCIPLTARHCASQRKRAAEHADWMQSGGLYGHKPMVCIPLTARHCASQRKRAAEHADWMQSGGLYVHKLMVCIPLTARHCASQRKRAAEHADWMQSGGLYGHKPMVCIPLTARHCASQRKRAAEHADWMQSGGLYGHKPMVCIPLTARHCASQRKRAAEHMQIGCRVQDTVRLKERGLLNTCRLDAEWFNAGGLYGHKPMVCIPLTARHCASQRKRAAEHMQIGCRVVVCMAISQWCAFHLQQDTVRLKERGLLNTCRLDAECKTLCVSKKGAAEHADWMQSGGLYGHKPMVCIPLTARHCASQRKRAAEHMQIGCRVQDTVRLKERGLLNTCRLDAECKTLCVSKKERAAEHADWMQSGKCHRQSFIDSFFWQPDEGVLALQSEIDLMQVVCMAISQWCAFHCQQDTVRLKERGLLNMQSDGLYGHKPMVCIPLTARHCASQRKRAAEHADWMQSGGLYGHKPMVCIPLTARHCASQRKRAAEHADWMQSGKCQVVFTAMSRFSLECETRRSMKKEHSK
ncbi:hypothetical protein TNCV_1947221 [Trichonephila clavipes]|nr:hypothetical protein TNCV_1947221 [Trichonephila clavipes]